MANRTISAGTLADGALSINGKSDMIKKFIKPDCTFSQLIKLTLFLGSRESPVLFYLLTAITFMLTIRFCWETNCPQQRFGNSMPARGRNEVLLRKIKANKVPSRCSPHWLLPTVIQVRELEEAERHRLVNHALTGSSNTFTAMAATAIAQIISTLTIIHIRSLLTARTRARWLNSLMNG